MTRLTRPTYFFRRLAAPELAAAGPEAFVQGRCVTGAPRVTLGSQRSRAAESREFATGMVWRLKC